MGQDPHMVAAVRACLQGEGVRSAARRFDVSKSALARRVNKAREDMASDAVKGGTGGTPEVGQGGTEGQPGASTPPIEAPELVRTMHPELKPRQQMVLQALLRGATQKEAAQEAGCSEGSVSGWMKPGHLVGQLYREINNDRQRAYLQRARDAIPKALDVVIEGMQATKPMVVNGEVLEFPDHGARQRAADSLLDRTGVLPKLTQVEQQHTGDVGVVLSLPQMEDKAAELRRRREELAAERRRLEGE